MYLCCESYPSERSMHKVGKQVEETVRIKAADFAVAGCKQNTHKVLKLSV